MAELNNKYTEIRCAAKRPHFIFNRCGGLMGGIDTSKPSKTIIGCPKCGQFWLISVHDNGNTTMQPIKKRKKIRFLRQWRTIGNAI